MGPISNLVLRLFPPVPVDMRIANTDTCLPLGAGSDGNSMLPIKKGQRILFSSFSAHRQRDVFGEDSAAFRPERWDDLKYNCPAYIPFHTGPRSCPGRKISP